MTNSVLQSCADRFSDRKGGLPSRPAAQLTLGVTIMGDSTMKRIKLTKGQLALVDDADFEWLNQWKWHAVYNWNKTGFYVKRNSSRPNRKNIYMHRIILNSPKGLMVDHQNGNGLDNQRHNLRLCTNQGNLANSQKHKKKTSKYKGVHKHGKSWRSQVSITIKGKRIRHDLGSHNSPETAAHAYDKKAIELFGEFARLNFPEE